MIDSGKPVVENTEENRQICRKYCTICQNYKRHSLEKHQPTELFCSCGQSSASSMKEIGCFCPACELFIRYFIFFLSPRGMKKIYRETLPGPVRSSHRTRIGMFEKS
jgi:hypothetical protein